MPEKIKKSQTSCRHRHQNIIWLYIADIEDYDRAIGTLTSICRPYHWLRHIFAGGGDPGGKQQNVLNMQFVTAPEGF